MKISQLPSPAFLVNLRQFERNTARMIQRARDQNLSLRPHVKTHKTIEGTRLQLGNEFDSITVSTLAESRFLFQAGFRDQTYAVPIQPEKLNRIGEMIRSGGKINILVDSIVAVEAANDFAQARDIRLGVFLKVDCGYHRAGVNPCSDEALKVAQRLHDALKLDFKGILTHAGQSYSSNGVDEIKAAAEQERNIMVGFAERLERAGIACREVSVGSTPTAVQADSFDGITELRPGNYVFFDRYQVDIGTCSIDDCAASVLARVIGRYKETNHLVIDAGALALSKDPGATHLQNSVSFGYVIGHPELRISGLSQEHGIVTSEKPIEFSQFSLGSCLRIIPNHSCLSAALFPTYYLVEGDEVIGEWSPVRGW